MGILEWSISARDPLIYFAMCLSIPSMALYIAEIVTILRHKQFHNSFYSLFIIRAIPDLLYVLDSFYGYRLPILFGSVLYPVYSLLPNWMICLVFFLTGYTFQANNLATAFILLNRLTAITLPLMHERLWRKFLPLVAIVVFCVPICSNWVMFKSEGILQKENPNNSADQSLLLYEAGDAPFLNYLNYMDAASSVIFMSVCFLINIVALTAYKRHKNKCALNPDSSDQLERKLFIYALATFSGHALIACLFIGTYIATNSQNMPMAMAMYAHYPWVMDTGSVVLSSWLLLWAGDSFRQQLMKDYRIARIRCDTRATNNQPLLNKSYEYHQVDLRQENAYTNFMCLSPSTFKVFVAQFVKIKHIEFEQKGCVKMYKDATKEDWTNSEDNAFYGPYVVSTEFVRTLLNLGKLRLSSVRVYAAAPETDGQVQPNVYKFPVQSFAKLFLNEELSDEEALKVLFKLDKLQIVGVDELGPNFETFLNLNAKEVEVVDKWKF
uniref:Serpentine receptor class gamma n=1 Tax=Globodera rostochiensis TaxID=31243 RepID=A0A914H2U0_GLORO